jgi:alanine dehydrogenase
MQVGVPKEIKAHEYRVGLTPGAVREYVACGHSVFVERNAGEGIGASDEDYRKAGADVADTAWRNSLLRCEYARLCPCNV